MATPSPTATKPIPTVTTTMSPTFTPTPLAGAQGWTSFTNANHIRALLLDKNGDLWAGGPGGVAHWNLTTGDYIKYTMEDGLVGNNVTSMAQAADGAMWFGVQGAGVSRFDGASWTTFTSADGLPGNNVLSVAATPDGYVWVDVATVIIGGTTESTGGMARHDGTNWVTFVGGFDRLFVSSDGTLWSIEEKSAGLSYFDGENWIDYNYTHNRNLPDQRVLAMAVALDGTPWVATPNGVYHFNGQTWDEFKPWEGEIGSRLMSMAVTPDGNVWLGFSFAFPDPFDRCGEVRLPADEWGLYRYDGKTWQNITVQDGLVSDKVCSVLAGPDGSVWVGTYDQGISRFDGQSWTAYQTQDKLLSDDILSLDVADHNLVWVGHPEGASRYDGQVWSAYRQLGQLKTSEVFGFGVYAVYIDPDRTVWLGGWDGAVHFDGSTWTTYSQEEYNLERGVSDITASPDGKHIFATGAGASEFDGLKWETFAQLKDSSILSALALPDGSLWFSGRFGGVYSYDGITWQHYPQPDGWRHYAIDSIAIGPDGDLWFSSCFGIARFDGETWITYQLPQDLDYGCAIGVKVAPDGTVWVGMSEGLLEYSGNDWQLVSFQSLTGYRVHDIALASDGAIWIATNAGLLRYMPPQ
jgi:ligand-binding sensor domain-containing protein